MGVMLEYRTHRVSSARLGTTRSYTVMEKIGSSSLIPIELHNFYSMRFDITFDNFHYVYFYAGTYNDAPVGQNTDSYVFSEIINFFILNYNSNFWLI